MGSKKVTIGYWYGLGIHMGLCRGPVNGITKIMAGGKTAWTGNQTASGSFAINQSSLFGGEKKEGGIFGRLHVFMGERAQTAPDVLVSRLGGDVPGFRGVTTLYFDGLIAAMNPYVKPWEIWAWRTTAGWENDDPWYPERATILLTDGVGGTIHAMNPAHIIVECHTNHDWGGGTDRSTLDNARMRAAADTLYAEGFGLCLDWVRQGTVAEFIQGVCEHIGALWRQNRLTGLFELKLIRADYDPETLPVFDEDTGLLGIDEEERADRAGATNEVIVKWEEPLSGEARQWRERNLASISASGQVVSESTEYAGIPTAELAGRVAARDLLQKSVGIRRFKLRFDRRAYRIQIGDVFRIRSHRRGIENIVLRAGRVEDGTLDKGEISITAVQDVFGLPATAITVPPPPSEWVEPDRTPLPITTRQLVELSWRDLATWLDQPNLEIIQADETAAYLALLAAAPSSLSYGFVLQTRVGAAPWENHDDGDFAGTALLASALPIGADTVTFALTDDRHLDNIAVGDALLIEDEICRLVSYDAIHLTGTLARGCVDTVPAAHAAGVRIWLLDDAAAPTVAWTNGTTVQVRALTKTSIGILPEEQAISRSITLTARQARPYPPGNFRINDEIYPVTLAAGGGDGQLLPAYGADMSSTDPDNTDNDYLATGDTGAQWIFWEFSGTRIVGKIVVQGDITSNGKSIAAMLNGCVVLATTDDPTGTPVWSDTGVTLGGIDDTGAMFAFSLPSVTCRAIRLYKTDGQVGVRGESYDSGGILFYAPDSAAPVTVSWSHRDRIVQADQLIDTAQGNVGPEPGTTYRLRIYSPVNTLRRTYSGITGTSQTYATADEITDGGPFSSLRVVLEAQRDGLTSHQAHDWTVTRS